MEFEVLVVVKKVGNKYLLVEDHAKRLFHFPTQSTGPSQSQNDVKVTAQLILDEVVAILIISRTVLSICALMFTGTLHQCQTKGDPKDNSHSSTTWKHCILITSSCNSS